jgi:hypothetical protein
MPEKDNSYKETMSVIDKYSKSIKKEKGIRNTLYGLDYAGQDKIYDGKIHVICLGYGIDKNLKYGEAREYFYSIVDGLLDHINKNTQLEKYFFHYPVDYSDLEFHFSFEDDRKGLLKRDEMHSIHIVRNEIFYEIINEEGPNEIKKDQISPDIYIMKGILERNRSIIRTVPEDLAMHSK